MDLRVVTELKIEDLPEVMALDAVVYEQQYVGELANMEARFLANKETFVCLRDDEQDRLAGYINFFPCTEPLYRDIIEESDVIRDDDIGPDEIAAYSRTENHLYIISVAVHPDYRDIREVIGTLSNGWVQYLSDLQAKGYPITDISATAVSGDGKKWLRNHLFVPVRTLSDENTVFLCEENYIRKLLEVKSYQHDVYLMLPLADNKKNTRLDNWLASDLRPECPPKAQKFMEELDNCLQYECDNAVLNELEILYLGDYDFLHTIDEYPGKDERENYEEIIVGLEQAYIFLTAHRPTHMYVLTIFIPDSRYSATQVEDQLSQGYLKFKGREKGAPFFDIYDFVLKRFGLLKCGAGKCILCMSNKPEEEMEFQNILTGEVYNSVHIDYHIRSAEVAEMCNTNYAQYDYYEVYLSEMVIAFIMNDYTDDVDERIEVMATYAFIAELVMFQNTSLAKAITKINNALANDGDISHEQVLDIYQDFGKTVRFWELHNFKYMGTQAEAAHITKAFGNEELKANYYEHQQYLEHIVELKAAQSEARNGTVLNIVATVLAVIQIQSFAVDGLTKFYGWLGIDEVYAAQTFNTGVVGIPLIFIFIVIILSKKKKNQRKTYLSLGLPAGKRSAGSDTHADSTGGSV